MHILVLGGGNGLEREVSLRSSSAVAEALVSLGHKVTHLDPALGDKAIRAAAKKCDVIFPDLEDGILQALLDDIGVPYIGSGSKASLLCSHKADYKQVLIKQGISTPAHALVNREQFMASRLIRQPFVLKPNVGGSSIDTFIVRDSTRLPNEIWAMLDRHAVMLLEELIVGQEITVPVLANQALPVVEIILPPGEEFDYKNKYNNKPVEHCPPINVSKLLQVEAQHLALQIHNLAGCRHFSRTDMIITSTGEVFVLETNTVPGLTPGSLYPKAAAAVGLTLPQLMTQLLDLCLDETAKSA